MLSLTVYGGVNEIGGNKVLLEDSDTRLFFDFGTSFGERYHYFEEYLKPRPGVGLRDFLEMGLLPPLHGIYRDDFVPDDAFWLQYSSAPRYRELTVDGVLLSHAHIDHSGYISFLRDDIPIYATAMTAFIAKAMQDSGISDFEKEVCYLNRRNLRKGYLSPQGPYRQRQFVFLDDHLITEKARAFWNWSPAKSKLMKVAPVSGARERVKHLPIRYFPVDHSIFGATAFAVETSSGWVGYTGDLRLHGKGGHQTEGFIQEMRALKPYILICEGTRAGDERHITEEEVYENARQATRQSKGLVVADFSPRNVERLLTFRRIAQETNRRLVILAKDAYLLDAMTLVSDAVPKLGVCPDIAIYKELRARPSRWEEELWRRYSTKMVTASQIHAAPDDFILCFSFWDIKHLIDIAPQGGTYIYSSSEAYSEEQQIDLRRLHHWIDHFHMNGIGLPREQPNWEIPEDERGLHASGHASGAELLSLIETIAPQILIPIHTLDPGYFRHHLQGRGIEVYAELTVGQPLTFAR